MIRSPQSIPSRRRKCCRCNGVNARCKFCACAKANRACTDCLPSKDRCCQNAPTSIIASNNVSTDSHSHLTTILPHVLIPSSCLCHNHCYSCLPLHYLQMQVTLIVESSLNQHLLQRFMCWRLETHSHV